MPSRSPIFCLILLLGFSAVGARGACPETAPGMLSIWTWPFHCSESAACPNGEINLILEGLVPPSNLPNPNAYSFYRVQPCDVVEWTFGDGETISVNGSEQMRHLYPDAGNYMIRAKVSNALGSTTVMYDGGRPAVIANSPSQLDFGTSSAQFTLPGGRNGSCSDCVLVHEDIGEATIPVLRSLDLSRATSADMRVVFDNTVIRVPVILLPGETQKNLSLQIPNDELYTGYRSSGLRFENATGGTLTQLNRAEIAIIDDDPAPTMSIEPHFEVKEGDTDLTPLSLSVQLTFPMGAFAVANSSCEDGSATNGNDFVCGYGPAIEPGGTSGFASAQIMGDRIPESDKTFRVRIAPRFTSHDPEFGATTCLVTILNDDAAMSPARVIARSGSPVKLTLDLGSSYAVPTLAKFKSTASDIVPAPQPAVIPAGATKVDVMVTPRAAGTASITAVVPDRSVRSATITAIAGRRRSAGH